MSLLPHGDLKKLDENLWIVEGTLPFHMPLPRTMTVYRMRDGGLWIHSAIALNPETQKKLEAFGEPRVMVVPSPMHRLDAPVYKKLYPGLRVVCPESAREKVEEKVPVDDTCENEFADPSGEITFQKMPGAKPIELAYEVPLKTGGRAMIINDVLVNVPDMKGIVGGILKWVGRGGAFRSPPSNKLLLLNDRSKFRGWLEEQSRRTDLKIVTVAHGDAVVGDLSRKFAEAARQM